MILEIIGYKGIVGNATYKWMKAMHPELEVIGRDKGDSIECKDMKEVISFICVPEAFVEEICEEASEYTDLVVIRSTVKPMTCTKLQQEYQIPICHNPEFLRESTAILDKFNPEFIVIGTCCEEHAKVLYNLYKPAQVQIIVTDTTTSELVKLSINSYLATIITYWNKIEEIAQSTGITTGHKVGAIASLDSRISSYGARYHQQYGGKCLPKDLQQLIEFEEDVGLDSSLFKTIQEVNSCLKSL